MQTRLLSLALACSAAFAIAGEEPASKSRARELLKARIAADAKKTPAPKAPVSASTASPTGPLAPADTAEPTSPEPTPVASKSSTAKPAPTVLPKVEVRKDRITETDQKIAQQERDIAREKRNLKSSELDNALNDSKLARPLAIFGGESTQYRNGVAAERVELMEAEKDLIEAIGHAKTKKEKAELQNQLDQLRTLRRQLEKTLR